MKASHLHDLWASPDNTRLTSKQFSFRLPTHVAAKIAALCEMFPTKNRTQIVADLLTSALDELEKNLPEALGEPVEEDWSSRVAEQIGQEGEKLYYLGGPRGRFHRLADAHFAGLEKELGNDSPEPLYGNTVMSKADLAQ